MERSKYLKPIIKAVIAIIVLHCLLTYLDNTISVIVASSITPELIEFLIANGWDGKLPTIVGGDTTTILPTYIFKNE